MNEREAQALDVLTRSKKYRGVCPETVERTFVDALKRYGNLKQADKAAREKLHQITGAFMTASQLKAARECLAAYAAGDTDALWRALRLHASTAERLPVIDALYDRAFQVTGKPGSILDLACGLNPLYLGARGLCARAHDISGGAVDLVNCWAARCGWDVSARVTDLTLEPVLEPCELALMMKLLPVLEQQRKGSAMALLKRVPAKRQLVSFPTRTLSGRGVGMEQNYSRWFEANLPGSVQILDRFVLGSELCYITEAIDG